MRKICLLLLTMLALSVQAQRNYIRINVSGVQGTDSLSVTELDGHFRTTPLGKIPWKEGKTTIFPINDNVVKHLVFRPYYSDKNNPGNRKYIFVYTCPGEDVEVSGTIDKPIVSSAFHKRIDSTYYADSRASVMYEKAEAKKEQDIKAGVPKEKAEEEFQQQIQIARAVGEADAVEYIRNHPDDEMSVLLLNYVGRRVEEADLLLSPSVKNGIMRNLYKDYIEVLRNDLVAENAEGKVVEGSMAPDFTKKDRHDKELSLSSLRGKYVVLDFWGSWCVWCIKGVPDMKKYYEKYKGKFEILGVACRDKKENWLKALDKYELPWLNVLSEGQPEVSALYAVSGFPTKIVIAPDGKILKIIKGESNEFYQYLEELFGK